MAVIYLRHSRHGNKVAVAEEEAVADEANGWERYSVAAVFHGDAMPKEVVTGADIEQKELAELRQKWEEKHGKPPHHRKGIETMRAELESV